MRKQLPKEPIILAFDPAQSEDLEIRDVFADEVAKTLWMMIKPLHLCGPDFNTYCLARANLIRDWNPNSARDLHSLLTSHGIHESFFTRDFEESREFLERLFAAISGTRPLRYKMILPGTHEENLYHRDLRRRGFWHALHGRQPANYSEHYYKGYTRGSKFRKRIREAPSQLSVTHERCR